MQYMMEKIMKCSAQLIFIVLLVGTRISSHATSMFELELKELATGSQQVVQAKVTAVVPQWENNQTVINTYVRLNIIDDLIGDDEDNEIIVKIPGGRIGTTELRVEGTATYNVGEENVLFLFRDVENRTIYQTLGMYQGKYSVYADGKGIRRVARDTTGTGAALFKRAGAADIAETGDHLSLEDFKKTVIQYIKSEK